MAKLNDLVLLGLFAALCATFSEAFAVHPRQNPAAISRSTALKMSDNDDEKLKALGYTADEITRSRKESDKEEIKVRVDLVGNVDPVSLTAIGFGLIALNFFVFANMGNGGIGGLVASIINTMNN